MNGRYILVDGQPVPEPDLIKWGEWLEKPENKRFLYDTPTEGVNVSTVFLGLDHAFGVGPPILWETMIFGGEHDQYQERYTSEDDARAGHAKAVGMVTP